MSRRNRIASITVGVAILAGVAAGVARADYLKGDPRKCPPSTGQTAPKPADCAKAAAKITLLTYMRAHRGKYWSNPISCTQAAPTSLLTWRCSFMSGTAVVWFRPSSTGWTRVVTVKMNP